MPQRFGHEVWPDAKCGHCGFVETHVPGGFYTDIHLYQRKCGTCGLAGCVECIKIYPRLGNSVSLDDKGKVTMSTERCNDCQLKVEAQRVAQRFAAHIRGSVECPECVRVPVRCTCGGLRHTQGVDGVKLPKPLPMGALIETYCDTCGLDWTKS